MIEQVVAGAGAALLAVLFGIVIPWIAMRMLLSADGSEALTVANYRGRPVRVVLGAVWPIWAVSLLVAQGLLELLAQVVGYGTTVAAVTLRISATPLSMPLFSVPFILVTGAFAFGMLDDAFGTTAYRGFGGHLGALRSGVLTTGMLKVLGIGGLALFYGTAVAPNVLARSGIDSRAGSYAALLVVGALLAAGVIALSANLVNLFDLRPGRALKVYALLVVAPAAVLALHVVDAYNAQVAGYTGELTELLSGPEEVLAAVTLVAVLLGPLVAVWRYDLGERGMLGDAGANAAGAVVGYLLTAILPITGLAVAFGVLLIVNLASERISYSAVIERVGVLRGLDRIGRVTVGPGSDSEAEENYGTGSDESADDAAHGTPVRYDANGTAREGED